MPLSENLPSGLRRAILWGLRTGSEKHRPSKLRTTVAFPSQWGASAGLIPQPYGGGRSRARA